MTGEKQSAEKYTQQKTEVIDYDFMASASVVPCLGLLADMKDEGQEAYCTLIVHIGVSHTWPQCLREVLAVEKVSEERVKCDYWR